VRSFTSEIVWENERRVPSVRLIESAKNRVESPNDSRFLARSERCVIRARVEPSAISCIRSGLALMTRKVRFDAHDPNDDLFRVLPRNKIRNQTLLL